MLESSSAGRVERALGLIAGAALLSVPVLQLIPVGYGFRVMRATAGAAERSPRPFDPRGALTALRLGVVGTFGSFAWLALPGTLLFTAWLAGWVFSFEGATRPSLGPTAAVTRMFWPLLMGVGAGLTAPLLVYLPLAQTHFALHGRLRAYADLRHLVPLMRGSAVEQLRLVAPAVAFPIAYHVGRTVVTFVPPTLDPVVHVPILFLFLRVKRGWAREYARRVARSDARPSPSALRRLIANATVVVAAVAATLAMLAGHFYAAYGPFDFLFPPLYTVPTLPCVLGVATPPLAP